MRQGSKRYFKLDPWKIIEDSFCLETNEISESVFTLGNEYMGTRGFFEEGILTNSVEDCFIGGIYVKEAQTYGWKRKGFANYSNSMVNTTNWLRLIIEVDGEKFSMTESSFKDYRRELDMREGVLRRELVFTTSKGCETLLSWERLISYSDRHVGAIRVNLKALNHNSPVKLSFVLDGVNENHTCFNNKKHCRPVYSKADSEDMYLLMNVMTTGQYYINRMVVDCPEVEFEKTEYVNEERYIAYNVEFAAEQGRAYTFDKLVSVWTTRDAGYPYGIIPKETDVTVVEKDKEDSVVDYLIEKSKENLKSWVGQVASKELVLSSCSDNSESAGFLDDKFESDASGDFNANRQGSVQYCDGQLFDLIREMHVKALEQLWNTVDIEIEGDEAAQQGIRYSIFQLANVYHGHDPYLNIGPKGYSSEHYWGRTFWDSESYCVPFYLFTNPEAAKRLIEYRYNTLDAARERAAIFDYKGAMYPMTTIDGSEDLNYWEYSFCEIHINSTVAYVVYLYDHMISDKEFLYSKGVEILVEVARFWASRGEFVPYRNGFGINRVIGPDEWQQFVNNNYYTNYMAKWVFEYASEVIEEMRSQAPDQFEAVCEKLKFDLEEVDLWREAAEKMILNYNEDMEVFIQDDMLLSLDPICREELDWEKDIPVESKWTIDKYFKKQLLKQPDILLLMFLFRDRFSVEQKLRNYRFYEQRTAHGSSLSPSIHSIIASEVGVNNQAYDYYLWASRLDLENANNNTHEGLHISSMAGTWLNVVCGFGGMKYSGPMLEFSPTIPEKWNKYSFKLRCNESFIKLTVARGEVAYQLMSGQPIKGKIYGQDVTFDQELKAVGMPEKYYAFTNPEAVIFDLDGVIVDTAKYHFKAWKTIADSEGIYFDEVINERLKGVSRMESLNIIMDNRNKYYSEQELTELANKKNELYVSLLDSLSTSDILPGIKSFIQELHRKGLKVALYSASKNVGKILGNLQITDLFDVIVTGADVSKTKPDPEGFVLAAQKLGVQNEKCVVVEDAFAGLQAARLANMRSIGIGDKCKLYNADYTLSSTGLLSLKTVLNLY